MAIGRSEDRDNPGNPMALRHRVLVRDPIREIHLGQRHLLRKKAGHMTAIDQTRRAAHTLRSGGRPHIGFRARPPYGGGGRPE